MSVLRCRKFILTVNNPREGDREAIEALANNEAVVYVGGQDEWPEGGTMHLQCGLAVVAAKTESAMAKWLKAQGLSSVHAEAVLKDNMKELYWTKEETRLKGGWSFQHGEWPTVASKTKGLKQNQMLDAATIIQGGGSKMDVLRAAPGAARSFGFILAAVTEQKLQKPRGKVHVRCFWGDAGQGKSTEARDWLKKMCDGKYWVASNGKWFDSYKGQDGILIDDMNNKCGWMRSQFLSLLESEYGVEMEVKGGHTVVDAHYIAVTSNSEPKEWFKGEDVNAVRRRFDEEYMYKGGKVVKLARPAVDIAQIQKNRALISAWLTEKKDEPQQMDEVLGQEDTPETPQATGMCPWKQVPDPDEPPTSEIMAIMCSRSGERQGWDGQAMCWKCESD